MSERDHSPGGLFVRALFPIGTAFLIAAIVIVTGNALNRNWLSRWEILKIDVRGADQRAKLRNVRIVENIFELDDAHCNGGPGASNLRICHVEGTADNRGFWTDNIFSEMIFWRIATPEHVFDRCLGWHSSCANSHTRDEAKIFCGSVAGVFDDGCYLPPSRIGRGVNIRDKSHAIGDNEGSVADDFGMSRYPTLVSGRAAGYCAAKCRDERKHSRRVVEPVLFIFTAFCAGFWRMYFTAREASGHGSVELFCS
jgi:hypothetical protein